MSMDFTNFPLKMLESNKITLFCQIIIICSMIHRSETDQVTI